MHQHIARPQEVKPRVLKRKCFDVSLHKGHAVAHASGPSLLDMDMRKSTPTTVQPKRWVNAQL